MSPSSPPLKTLFSNWYTRFIIWIRGYNEEPDESYLANFLEWIGAVLVGLFVHLMSTAAIWLWTGKMWAIPAGLLIGIITVYATKFILTRS